MKFKKAASAGTMDSCDISIRIEAGEAPGNLVTLSSVVERQYGEHIRRKIHQLLDSYALTGVAVNAVDRGALDCTIEARVICAIHRACEEQVSFNEVNQWKA